MTILGAGCGSQSSVDATVAAAPAKPAAQLSAGVAVANDPRSTHLTQKAYASMLKVYRAAQHLAHSPKPTVAQAREMSEVCAQLPHHLADVEVSMVIEDCDGQVEQGTAFEQIKLCMRKVDTGCFADGLDLLVDGTQKTIGGLLPVMPSILPGPCRTLILEGIPEAQQLATASSNLSADIHAGKAAGSDYPRWLAAVRAVIADGDAHRPHDFALLQSCRPARA